MRNLIRPSLFITARLGLFLAVMAWIVGQQIHAIAGTPVGNLTVCRQGAYITNNRIIGCAVRCTGQRDESQTEPRFELRAVDLLVGRCSGFSVAGVTLQVYPQIKFTSLSIRHWLIVSMFVLFNGVLMWVYGKRGKDLAAGE